MHQDAGGAACECFLSAVRSHTSSPCEWPSSGKSYPGPDCCRLGLEAAKSAVSACASGAGSDIDKASLVIAAPQHVRVHDAGMEQHLAREAACCLLPHRACGAGVWCAPMRCLMPHHANARLGPSTPVVHPAVRPFKFGVLSFLGNAKWKMCHTGATHTKSLVHLQMAALTGLASYTKAGMSTWRSSAMCTSSCSS